MRARASLRAKRSNPEPQERMDCFVADAPRNDGTDAGARRFETVSQRVARMRARPSLRANGSRECAPERHCERSEAIQSRKKGWIASSLTLLAMTGRTPGQGVLRPSLRANGSRECAPDRHCERSEAIQSRK